jgi:dipeptidyl aminopeptidase/acylaminoacyl peptidase
LDMMKKLSCSKVLSCAIAFLMLSLPMLAQPPSLPALSRFKLVGRDFSVKELLASNNYYDRYLISYQSGNLSISGIMNLPKGKGPFPIIITNHGYIPPSVYTVGRGLKREQDYFARHGYIVIHPDYRNHGLSDKDPDENAPFHLAYEQDVLNLIDAVKKSSKPYFDKDNIGMLGHSRGGGITLNILVSRPDLMKAAVLYAPISMNAWDNFERWTLGRGRSGARRISAARARENQKRAQEILSLYGSPEVDPKFWQELSAENYLDDIQAPVMVFHGTDDDSVPLEWSQKLVKDLRAKNKNVQYYELTGEKHEFIKQWPFFMQKSRELFDRYLIRR